MTISQTGLELVKKHEGLRLTAYQDTGGVWTIGYGHTRTAKKGMTITKDQANQLLKSDIKTAENDVKKYVKVPLTQNEYDALVCFVFNIGGPQFAGSTLLKKLNAGDKKSVPSELLKWVYDNGRFIQGLLNRRKEQAALFTGTGGNIALVIIAVALLFVFIK